MIIITKVLGKSKPFDTFEEFYIMQWNSCGLCAHMNELKNFLFTLCRLPDVICVQEIFLKQNKTVHLEGYRCEMRDRDEKAKGGVATFIIEGIGYRAVQNKWKLSQ